MLPKEVLVETLGANFHSVEGLEPQVGGFHFDFESTLLRQLSYINHKKIEIQKPISELDRRYILQDLEKE